MTVPLAAVPVKCGLEFEYMLMGQAGGEAGSLHDFASLDFARLSQLLEDKPGLGDHELATGDMGIRSGYWYIEGDERFDEQGNFRTFAVKGVEIRTPPENGVEAAISRLLEIEGQLARRLASRGLGLVITALNPLRRRYEFDPPLNAFEQQLRAEDREYDGTEISTLTYGPDINLSVTGWDMWHNLDAARRLNYYAPYIVPFSFSSPFYAGEPWHGLSCRTSLRCAVRPAVKFYLDPEDLPVMADYSVLARPARLPRESGRIEFKAFDAMASVELLRACCHLVTGLCLARGLPGRSEVANVALYQRAALAGFADETIYQGARTALEAAREALRQAGDYLAAQALEPLERLLRSRITPAHALRAAGRAFHVGGLVRNHRCAHSDLPPVRVAPAG